MLTSSDAAYYVFFQTGLLVYSQVGDEVMATILTIDNVKFKKSFQFHCLRDSQQIRVVIGKQSLLTGREEAGTSRGPLGPGRAKRG